MNYRVKLLVVLLCALAILFIADTARSALNTISRLDMVEAERDHWQRSSDVIGALDLKPGNVVIDLGCGSGYFTLKLSSSVGQGGRVIAEDIRRLPLSFLWVRTALKREHNVSIVHGEPNVGSLKMSSHEISADRVQEQLRQANFEIVRRQDDFIQKDPDNETWWLVGRTHSHELT